MKPEARIILDSISPDGVRLTTVELKFHRTELSELNTHRMLSRGAASSRAISIKKMLENVQKDPAMPMVWGKDQSGMQSYEYLSDEDAKDCERAILNHLQASVDLVEYLRSKKLHKQFTNRYIEQWMTAVVIISSTEWINFFGQRCHPAAHPNMKSAADAIQDVYYKSEPKFIDYGEWHLPFIKEQDFQEVSDRIHTLDRDTILHFIRGISVARCARVSYMNHDGSNPDILKDYELFEKLKNSSPMHPSPLEHVATPCTHMKQISKFSEFLAQFSEESMNQLKLVCRKAGNFNGWHQFRKYFPHENITEFVPNLE